MDATTTDRLVGHLLDRRYRLDRRISRGGMGTVYRATDLRLDRPVAVKVLKEDVADQELPVRLFMREAQSQAKLSHPHVVAVYDQGRDAGSDDVYLVMELIEGGTLRDILRARGALPPGEALALMEPVLSALAAAHAKGLIHRDIKPENVLVATDGTVKVADFGLARAIAASTHSMTVGQAHGTPAYLSPEQANAEPTTARSDVYSLGLVLFELLTGSTPFQADTATAVSLARIHRDVPSPSELVPLPRLVDGLVERACSRTVDERFDDAGEFLERLRAVRRQLGAENAAVTAAQVVTTSLMDTTVLERRSVVDLTAPRDDDGQARTADLGRHRTAVLGGSTSVLPTGGDTLDGELLDDSDDDGDLVPARRRRSRKGLIALLVVLLLAAAAGGVGWYLGSGRYTTAPALLSLTSDEATSTARRAGLDVTVTDPQPGDFSETVEAGRVLRQDPDPNARIRRGGTVSLTLSRGPERFTVPDVVGLPLEQAGARITDNELTVGAVDRQFSESAPQGQVLSATPPAGSKLKRGTVVDLVVSKGRAPITVPDVRGRSLRSAGQQLDGLGLRSLKGEEVFSDTVPAGDVVAQTLAPGSTAFKGDEITLTVSKGPDVVTVPSVRGKNVDEARKILADAGLTVNVNAFPGGPGRVLEQSPGGGKVVKRGTTVTLYVL